MDKSTVRQMNKTKTRYADLAGIALVAVAIVIFMFQASAPELDPEDFATINKVFVPDHAAGQDPYIIYDRDNWKDHEAAYHVEVVVAGTDKLVCENRGIGAYKKGDKITDKTLNWYVGKRCNLKSGRYLLKTHWRISESVHLHNTSNVFYVLTTRNDR